MALLPAWQAPPSPPAKFSVLADNGTPWLRKRVTLCTAGRPWPGLLESQMDTSCPCQTDHLLMNTLLPSIINPDSPSGRPLRPPGPAREPCVLGGERCVRMCASISPLGRAHWPSGGGAAGRVALQDFYSDLHLSELLGTCTWYLYSFIIKIRFFLNGLLSSGLSKTEFWLIINLTFISISTQTQ